MCEGRIFCNSFDCESNKGKVHKSISIFFRCQSGSCSFYVCDLSDDELSYDFCLSFVYRLSGLYPVLLGTVKINCVPIVIIITINRDVGTFYIIICMTKL